MDNDVLPDCSDFMPRRWRVRSALLRAKRRVLRRWWRLRTSWQDFWLTW